jgi:peroxiredoxin
MHPWPSLNDEKAIRSRETQGPDPASQCHQSLTSDINDGSLARYKLTATPTTLLIDDDGKVEHAWVGKWDEEQANEVAAALK